MRARPLCIMSLGFLLGILVASTKNHWVLLPIVLGWLLLAGQIKLEKSRLFGYGKLLFYTIGFILGAYQCEVQQEFRAEYEPLLYDEMKVILQGELEEKEYKNHSYLYYLNNCYLKLEQDEVSVNSKNAGKHRITACNQVIVEMEDDTIPIGKVLVLEGDVKVFYQARNEGNFDEKSFYQSQKIDFKLKNVSVVELHGEEDEFREMLYQLKMRLKNVYANCMTAETRGVITMMALGDKSLMDTEIKELYQKVGISHVLAISGLHISVIGMTIYKLLRRLFGSFVISGTLAGGFMFAYGCMAGFRPSATRAIIMFFMMLLGQMLGRSYDSLSALSLSGMWLLWENVFLLEYAGFLFSYGAVLGVVLVGKIVIKTFQEKNKLRDSLYSSFSIQLVTVPLTAYFYFEVPVYGMLVNFLVLPMMSMLLFFGLLGGFMGLVWMDGARWMLAPCQLILLFYQKLSGVIQGLPNAGLITGQPELWRMIVFYCALVVMIYMIWKRKKVRGYIVAGVLLLIFVLHLPNGGMEVNILDVGQGDGIYLRTSSGYDVFIDGGSTDTGKVGTYRILPFLKCRGVKKIDYWFVSHADKDHISGLQEVLALGYSVENLVFAKECVVEESYNELLQLAERVGTEVLHMGYLDCLHLGDASLTCVFPYDGFVADDKNAASLVLYYEDNSFDGLFTGDIGTREEAWIAEHCQEWMEINNSKNSKEAAGAPMIDLYKVAHHGSRYSNSTVILEVLRPKVAVISSGVNNSYGHPHAEAVERLEEAGCEIFSTAASGQVTVEVEADNGKENGKVAKGKVQIGEEVGTPTN